MQNKFKDTRSEWEASRCMEEHAARHPTPTPIKLRDPHQHPINRTGRSFWHIVGDWLAWIAAIVIFLSMFWMPAIFDGFN